MKGGGGRKRHRGFFFLPSHGREKKTQPNSVNDHKTSRSSTRDRTSVKSEKHASNQNACKGKRGMTSRTPARDTNQPPPAPVQSAKSAKWQSARNKPRTDENDKTARIRFKSLTGGGGKWGGWFVSRAGGRREGSSETGAGAKRQFSRRFREYPRSLLRAQRAAATGEPIRERSEARRANDVPVQKNAETFGVGTARVCQSRRLCETRSTRLRMVICENARSESSGNHATIPL